MPTNCVCERERERGGGGGEGGVLMECIFPHIHACSEFSFLIDCERAVSYCVCVMYQL